MTAAPARGVVVVVAGLPQPRWGRPHRGTRTLGWAGEWLSAPPLQAAAIPERRGQGAWGAGGLFILPLERGAGALQSCQKAVLTRELAGSSEKDSGPSVGGWPGGGGSGAVAGRTEHLRELCKSLWGWWGAEFGSAGSNEGAVSSSALG